MTTFERFQRDARSRMNSNSKSLKKMSVLSSESNLRRLVSFSAREILFLYQPRRKFATFSLLMKNLTGNKIYFKVRCNNSKGYLVIPYEEVIADQDEILIKFQFFPSQSGLQAHRKDKFEIVWGKLSHNPNVPTTFTESKIFPVVIDKVANEDSVLPAQAEMGKGIFGSQKFHEEFHQFRDQAPPVQNFSNFNLNKQPPMELKSSNHSKIETPTSTLSSTNSLLTKNTIIIVSVVSFIFGFLLT